MMDFDKLSKEKKMRWDELNLAFTKNMRELRVTNDADRQARLEIENEGFDKELQSLEEEIKSLKNGQLLQRSAEELQQRIVSDWERNQHLIDFYTPLGNVEPILGPMGRNRNGGTAIFLIPETNRMFGEWLVKRILEWDLSVQKAALCMRSFTVTKLDHSSVLTELSKQFGVQPQTSSTDKLNAIRDAIFESAPDNNTIMALQISIPPDISAELFCSYIPSFLSDIWKCLVNHHSIVTQKRNFFRLVIFILTDVSSRNLSAEIGVKAPAHDCNKCTFVRIAPWKGHDINEWLVKFSALSEIGSQNDSLQRMGDGAFAVGKGIPLTTWSYLQSLMKKELIHKLEEMTHGKLATISV